MTCDEWAAMKVFFYPGNGWAGGLMTRQGSTGLVRIDIKQ